MLGPVPKSAFLRLLHPDVFVIDGEPPLDPRLFFLRHQEGHHDTLRLDAQELQKEGHHWLLMPTQLPTILFGDIPILSGVGIDTVITNHSQPPL